MTNWLWQTVTLLLLYSQLGGTDGRCQHQPTCSECLRISGCAWCKQRGFLQREERNERRCDTVENLRRRNCSEVINPKPGAYKLRDKELESRQGSVVQLRPQETHLRLRVGKPQTFKVVFKRAEGYPIDLYYLMDLSYSMKDDLEKVKTLGWQIVVTMKNVTNAVRIGFGSFVEKVTDPFVDMTPSKLAHPCVRKSLPCQPSFSFQNVLKLTDNVEEFEKRVSKQNISSNLDNAESGLDAVMQIAVCQHAIGWNDVTRLLVYTSDGPYHLAGDGKIAGIYLPNDGKCHLSRDGFYEKDTLYDYPSVGHLSEVLSANNIKLIFAVTKNSLEKYQELSKLIPQSVVGVLAEDSGNVVQLISDAYANLTSTLILEHRNAPAGVHISYNTQCSDGTHSRGQKRGECTKVGINEQVNFTVTVTSMGCLPRNESFIIKVQGLNEELLVTLETLCDCVCNDTEEQSSDCNGKGTFTCGVCSCDEGYTGKTCECERKQNTHSILALEEMCIHPNSTLACSGRGTCLCGHCTCGAHHRGQYCQCDDLSCNRHNNLLCGGNGKCDCGMCECFSNYSGSACECSTLTDQCQTGNGGICSHHGQCECNQCKCHPGFSGKYCTELQNRCQKYT
ncbi:integrin beta-7-like [Chanos chanos]|uniref:Integrin beta n=1 Tax=Chanos chanos TaxID=29144 RepID=A0A6J2USV5_CHACN|nr:integrin beta-7-like [Chanos chanos]